MVAQLNDDAHTAQDVKLTIRGVSDSGQTIEINQATTVQSDQTQIVIMRIGELGSGSYTLTAKGNSPIVFDQTAQLTYVHKSYSVFIQTDKAIYRESSFASRIWFIQVHFLIRDKTLFLGCVGEFTQPNKSFNYVQGAL